MKATVCVLLLAAALVSGAEEKKNEKRGILGLGYGGYSAPLVSSHGYYGHGLGLYGHGGLGYGHGSLGYSHGGLGYGHGLGLGYGHGLGLGYGHSVAAPLVSHAPLAYGAYSAPLLGHGYVGHGWH